MRNKSYNMLPGLVTFHTSLLENSIYSNEVFRLIEQYFRERVGVGMEFSFCDEVPSNLDNRLNIGISEMGIDDRVRRLMSEKGFEDHFEDFKRTYEETYNQEGFSEIDSSTGGISLVSFPFEKTRFDIAKESRLNYSTLVEIEGMMFRPSDYFTMPPCAYEYTQKFASRICNAISDVCGVGFVDEAPVDLAEDLNGDIILNPNSVDPSLLKYHFFFRDSQKAKMREFFSS